MTVELRILAFSVLLGVVQIVAASHSASLQRGYRWSSSPRDGEVPPLQGVAGRLDRALRNFVETFPLFAAAVLAAHVLDVHNALTEWGVWLYFLARVAYVLLYAAGIPLVRSLVWNVATVGILLLVVALFFG
ncbi:MAG: MAPEG family protein [Rubrobacter sp.]|nr:MAPEG family protein [Rubrobacter sp.]